MIIKFKIQNQTLIRLDSFKPVENSKEYLYVNFEFSEDWNSITNKRALFTYDDKTYEKVIDENNQCKVPYFVIKSSGFNIMVVGQNDDGLLIDTDNPFIYVLKTGNVNGLVVPLTDIQSDTLEVEKIDDIAKINIPNIYGTKLKLIKETGIIQLLGRNKNEEDVILNEIDLPTEKIITNIYYNETLESLVFQFENNEDIIVPIGDIFELDNYYTKNEINASINILKDQLNNITGNISNLNSHIDSIVPPQASAENKLADKDFVNSSIANSTATFRGTYTSSDLFPTEGVDGNDYLFLATTDALGNQKYDRYKYSNGEWVYEYTLNNSSFTEAQWKAINSGITNDYLSTLATKEYVNNAIQQAIITALEGDY